MKYGVYSARFAELYGSSIYSTPDGKEVEVSGVYEDQECSPFTWEDRVLLGPVDQWLRHGQNMSPEMKKMDEDWRKHLDERVNRGKLGP